MVWFNDALDLVYKLWVLIFVPIIVGVGKFVQRYLSLVKRVEDLETKLDSKIQEDRTDRELDREERKKTSDTITKIYDTLMQVKEDTAVNKAKIEKK
jgi:hypothetical protein